MTDTFVAYLHFTKETSDDRTASLSFCPLIPCCVFGRLSIPPNSTNVCLSPGQCNVTDRLPSQMRGWSVGVGAQIPRVTCNNKVTISCEKQSSLDWNLLDISDVVSQHQIFGEGTSINSTVSDCLFDDTNMILIHSSPESPKTTSVAPSLFRFIGNQLLGSSKFSFEDNTTGGQSYQEFINNTCPNAPTIVAQITLHIAWTGAYDRESRTRRHLLVENNTMPALWLHLDTPNTPQLNITGNHFEYCYVISVVSSENEYESSLVWVERNTMTVFTYTKSGAQSYGPLVVRHNRMDSAQIFSNGLNVIFQHNILRDFGVHETGGYVPGLDDVITDNTITTFAYTILFFNSLFMGPGAVQIRHNFISSAEISVSTSYDIELNMVDNIWTGPNAHQTFALHVRQLRRCVFSMGNFSMDNYRGGIKIASAAQSSIYIRYGSIRSSEKGGISISVENTYVDIAYVTLYNNTSPTVGGAISVSASIEGVIAVRDCSLIHNRSPHSSAVTNVSIIVQDDIDQPLVDHSVFTFNGHYHYENVSLSCAEERYLASSNVSSSLVWSCRPCATGTYFLGRGEMVEDVEKGNKCTRCPEKGVECVDGKTPISAPNYWCGKNSLQQLICHNCPSGYCNETAHLWNSSCIGHRSGELCGGCADGYTLGFLTSACLPVDHCRHEWIGLLSIIPFVYVTVLLFLPIGDGSMWKSMSYFVQTVPLLLKQEKQNSIITMFSSLFTTPTNMGSSSLGFCIGQMDYIEREFISLYVPAGTVILFLFGCLCILLYHKMGCTMPRRKIMFLTQALNKRSMLSRCTTGLVTGFLLMYSGLIASYLKLYFCIEIEPGRWVMYNAGTERCDQWWRTILISVASILLLPLPLVVFFVRRRLKGTERETGRDVLMVLDGCYRQSTKYWESVYMVRRVVIAVAYVFITDERWSATVMRFLLLTALFLHLFFTPFITAAGQWLETICLLSLCCLTVLNGQLEERYSHAFLVICQHLLLTAGLKKYRSSSRYRL
ncbi:hypothetical protein PROFUN_15056 [Planoprotostelium fungivorum]|uniref:Uncharacterized protein n=1 Tax=Planoprotostelium fungivorum TaxID=1890364 RepID=A0A2P6MXS0_9EUKA|nr:hypothetical protein PROFUN_15056 [Planoprotostelium fungivorum]